MTPTAITATHCKSLQMQGTATLHCNYPSYGGGSLQCRGVSRAVRLQLQSAPLEVSDGDENVSLGSSLHESLPLRLPPLPILCLPYHRLRTEMPNGHKPGLPTFEFFG